jgi:small subunit ribosomal protein S16
VGSKKNAVWRVVVADQRSPRDGRIIESIGHYNPQTEPSTIVIDRERLDHWIEQGAQPTNTIRKLMRAPNTETQVVKPADVPEPEEVSDAPPAEAAESGTDPGSADDAGPDTGAEAAAADARPDPADADPADAGPESTAPSAAEPTDTGDAAKPDQPEG